MIAARLRSWWYAAVPAVVALALGVWGIGATGPWIDERYTITALEDGFTGHVNEAPWLPYYAVVWVWTGFGNLTSVEWIRMLSVVAVAVAAACVAVTAQRLAGPKAGLSAGVLLAVAPGVMRYAQEARPYALPLALVAASTLLLVLAMRSGSTRLWVAYGVVLGIGGLILAVTFAAVPAHAVLLTSFPDWRSRARDWVATCLFVSPVVAIEVLLGLWFRGTHAWVDPPTIASLGTAWAWPVSGYTVGATTLVFAGALVVAGLVTSTGRRWVAASVVVLALVLGLSVTVMNWWTARTFIPFAGLLCVAAGVGLARLGWPWLVVIVTAMSAMTVPAHVDIRTPGSRGLEVREVAAVLRAHASAGDVLIGAHRMDDLPWVHRHLLAGDPDLTVASSLPSGGRAWTLGTTTSCAPARTWTLASGETLALCE